MVLCLRVYNTKSKPPPPPLSSSSSSPRLTKPKYSHGYTFSSYSLSAMMVGYVCMRICAIYLYTWIRIVKINWWKKRKDHRQNEFFFFTSRNLARWVRGMHMRCWTLNIIAACVYASIEKLFNHLLLDLYWRW